MSTTTIRLPEDLKIRIEKLAAASGKSAHAFMVDALSQSTETMERRLAFEAEAEQRWAKYQRTGEYVSLEDMSAYAKGLATGRKPAKPQVRKRLPADRSVKSK